MSDDLDFLRQAAPQGDEPTPDTVAHQRRLLMDHIRSARPEHDDSRRRRAPSRRLLPALVAIAATIAIVAIGVSAYVTVTGSTDHHASVQAGVGPSSSTATLFTPTSPAEYAAGIGILRTFEHAVETAATNKCLTAKGVTPAQTSDAYPAYAPGFEDPTALRNQGLASIQVTAKQGSGTVLPPGVDPATVGICAQAGVSAVEPLTTLLDGATNDWLAMTEQFETSPALVNAMNAWRSCMSTSESTAPNPTDFYTTLASNEGDQTTLLTQFARCLPAVNAALAPLRTAARSAYVSGHDLPTLSGLDAIVRSLAAENGVAVPSEFR